MCLSKILWALMLLALGYEFPNVILTNYTVIRGKEDKINLDFKLLRFFLGSVAWNYLYMEA